MKDTTLPIKYHYCPDYNAYVKDCGGVFYKIENGKEVINQFYLKILIGSIFTDDITEEEYNAHLY